MKAMDLVVVVENASKKEQQLTEAADRFAFYSKQFMQSGEYQELLDILAYVMKPGFSPIFHDKKSTSEQLVFWPSSEVPFVTSKALTWIDIVRDWAPLITGKMFDDESLAESFWEKFTENVNNRGYWYRMEHDEAFNKAEIARMNEESAVRAREDSRKAWRKFFTFIGVATFVVLLVFVLAETSG